jgi:hypothetical protein
MNLPNFVRTSIIAAFAVTVTWLVADAQISGTGTTGTTAGSGRGTGSAGVLAGTGPDVQPSVRAEQSGGVGAQQNITTTTTTRSENASSAKKESRNTRKHLKKTSSRSRSTPAPGASASPR